MRGPLLSDLDGTIADTAPVIFESLHVTCAAMGIDLPRDTDLSFALGPPLHWCLTELGVEPERLPDAISVFESAHTERIDLVVPMPGAGQVVRQLRSDGVRIGVATIKPQPIAELVLATIGLREHVDVVRGRADDLDPRTKSDLLRSALSELDGPDPLYIGDHDNDEQAARDCGIRFLRYPDSSWADVRAAIYGCRPMKPAS